MCTTALASTPQCISELAVTNPDSSSPRWIRWVAIAVIIVGAVFAIRLLPINDWIQLLLAWVDGAGVWGPVVFAFVYVAATVFLLPASILTLGAGFAFGVLEGSVLVSIASTTAAAIAFVLGRRVAGASVRKRVDAHPRFRAVAGAVERQGFKIVLLTRLSPVFPFVFLNYAFGLTGVRFRDYVLASWIGMMPGTVMYVYFGSAVTNLSALLAGEFEGGVAQQVLFWGGLAATVAVTVLVTRVARRALRDAEAAAGGADATDPSAIAA